MANLGQKNGIYHIRFRFQGKEYKKSLKTNDADSAAAAKSSVELTIHRLITGLIVLPTGIDPGDFILSGGTLQQSRKAPRKQNLPSTNQLICQYLDSQKKFLADSSHSTLAMHLRHLTRNLEDKAEAPCDRVTHRDLDGFQQTRLAERDAVTVDKERVSIRQFYKWAVTQGYLSISPAALLPPIKGGEDRPPFRTLEEIDRIIARGGLTKEEILELWECLYLSPPEIAYLLAMIRANAKEDFTYLLHALPAYTGMRRGEVLRLRWLDVDFEEDYLVARSRKQSRRRTEVVRRIDLHPELRLELLAWRQNRPKGQFVICDAKTLEPIEKNQANRRFWQPLRRTTWCLDSKRNWFKIGFHTYRHSFASNLASRGVDQRVIDEFLGHTTEAMRKRYRHLFPKDRRSVLSRASPLPQIRHNRKRDAGQALLLPRLSLLIGDHTDSSLAHSWRTCRDRLEVCLETGFLRDRDVGKPMTSSLLRFCGTLDNQAFSTVKKNNVGHRLTAILLIAIVWMLVGKNNAPAARLTSRTRLHLERLIRFALCPLRLIRSST